MGAYGTNIGATPGTGKTIKTYTRTNAEDVQVVREDKATASTTDQWTIATTAATSRIAADTSRVGITMTNIGGGRVYIRHDATAPTALLYHTYLDGGDRYEVPADATELAVSMLGSAAGGTIVSQLRTAA